MDRPTLLDLDYDEIVARLAVLGKPAYRADQIWRAVYRNHALTYDGITTLPAELRTRLADDLPLTPLQEVRALDSVDGSTRKILARLADGETIETVLMAYDARSTVCVSTQVGCAMGCALCATGRSGFTRDLSAGEIVAQVLHSAAWFADRGTRLSNVVYMGMGEPLANYDSTLESVRRLNDPRGLGLGARSFTISTVGIIPAIDRLAGEGLQVNLAVSLHAAEDGLRSTLVPVNQRYPLRGLIGACRRYANATHRRVTFEIALIDGVNDADIHARRAAALLRGLLCHVNLIPLNAVEGLPWKGSPPERVEAFRALLERAHIPVTVRRNMGADIQAACGQLRARNEDLT